MRASDRASSAGSRRHPLAAVLAAAEEGHDISPLGETLQRHGSPTSAPCNNMTGTMSSVAIMIGGSNRPSIVRARLVMLVTFDCDDCRS
jgi:hypothetical protein